MMRPAETKFRIMMMYTTSFHNTNSVLNHRKVYKPWKNKLKKIKKNRRYIGFPKVWAVIWTQLSKLICKWSWECARIRAAKERNFLSLQVWHGIVSYRGAGVPQAPQVVLNGGDTLPRNTSTYLLNYRAGSGKAQHVRCWHPQNITSHINKKP